MRRDNSQTSINRRFEDVRELIEKFFTTKYFLTPTHDAIEYHMQTCTMELNATVILFNYIPPIEETVIILTCCSSTQPVLKPGRVLHPY